MNFVGHHEVAARRGLDARGRLGAMLPDFATMLGVRLRRDALGDAASGGVDLHHRTDAAFHPLAVVRHGMAELTTALVGAGLGRGSARAIGHVGFEMLLDSVLTAPDVRATLEDAGDDADVAAALSHHPEWPVMRGHLGTRVARYDDPEWVAARLFHILERRPRLAFGREQVEVVAGVLTRAAPGIRAGAPHVFATVVDGLQSASRSD